MVFGELVIPSSRSLWDDDFTELLQHQEVPIKWDDADCNVGFPTNINCLIVIDTKPIVDVFKKSVVANSKPCKSSFQNGLTLYYLNNETYLLIYENEKSVEALATGEIIAQMESLIDSSVIVYGITSLPIASYQGSDKLNEETCTVFSLTTGGVQVSYRTLQVPNIITGICASLLAYRLCANLPCAVFVGFLDVGSPLDSVNTENLLQLIRRIGVGNVGAYVLKMEAPSNNLYT